MTEKKEPINWEGIYAAMEFLFSEFMNDRFNVAATQWLTYVKAEVRNTHDKGLNGQDTISLGFMDDELKPRT
jgi:hypothetical protein